MWARGVDTAEAGGSLAATTAIDAGARVLANAAYASTPLDAKREETCARCLRPLYGNGNGIANEHGERLCDPSAVSKCQQCHHVCYCSAGCEGLDARRHALECRPLQYVRNTARKTACDVDLLRIVVKILAQRASDVKADDDEATRAIGDLTVEGPAVCRSSWDDVMGLLVHERHFQMSWRTAVADAATRLRPRFAPETLEALRNRQRGQGHPPGDDALEFVDLFVSIAGRVNVNAHGVVGGWDGCSSVVAFGLFPLVAQANHSCAPNCLYSWCCTGGFMQVRALRPIRAGEEITVHYIDLYQNTRSRRAELLRTKHFLCMCARCCGAAETAQTAGTAGTAETAETAQTADERFVTGVCCAACGPVGGLLLNGTCGGCGTSFTREETEARTEAARHARRSCGDPPTRQMLELFLSQHVAEIWPEDGGRGTAASSTAKAPVPPAPPSKKNRRGNKKNKKKSAAGVAHPAADVAHKLVLHPMHELAFNALAPLSNACITAGDHGAAERYLRWLTRCTEAVYPPNFPETANFREQLASALIAAGERDEEARDCLARCLRERECAFGNDHISTESASRQLRRLVDEADEK